MHVTGADGPDEKFVAFAPERENDEYASPFVCSADGAKAPLPVRTCRIRENRNRAREKSLDDGRRQPVFFALSAVALIPIKAADLQILW